MQRQSRLMSLVEAITNVAVGYAIAVAVQLIAFPWFRLPARLDDALAIAALFTAVSVARSYILRRLFERLRPVGNLEKPIPSSSGGELAVDLMDSAAR